MNSRRLARTLAPLALLAFCAARPGAAQDSVITTPPLLGTLAIIRVQFNPIGSLDTTRWYEGTEVTTLDGCTFVTFPNLSLVNGQISAVRDVPPHAPPLNISYGHFRVVQTRQGPRDPWRLVDPTWVHSRALGC